MRILSVDPGSTSAGWSIITQSPRARPQFVAGGTCPVTPSALSELLADHAPVDVLAIETIEIYGAQGMAVRMRDLAKTSGAAELLRGLAFGKGIPVLGITASEWRLAVIGKRSPSDAEVKRTVTSLVDGLPRTNEHVRDATGLAILAARMCANGVDAAVRTLEARRALDERKRAVRAKVKRAVKAARVARKAVS